MTKEVIKRLRQYYKLGDDMSDRQVAILCVGSLGEAVINLKIAKEQFIKACKDAYTKTKIFK